MKNYWKSIGLFLTYLKDYDKLKGDKTKIINCEDGVNNEEKLRKGSVCNFEYDEIFEDTPCVEEKEFGYNSNKPCVLIKLNKMIDFVPITNGSDSIEITCYGDVNYLLFFLYFF